ncbi:MAG: Uma2 family endonuclease [Pseudomonadota bacterium]
MGQAILNDEYVDPATYLARDETAGTRHELIRGVLYAMVGASRRHNMIAGNISFSLRTQLRGTCAVFEQTQKLRVHSNEDTAFLYPDVMTICDPDDNDEAFAERPCLIVEVLSPSSQALDRIGKLAIYRSIPTLDTYILVAQDLWHIEVFERATGWRPRILGDEETISVCAGKATLTGAAIYDEVRF